MFSKWELVEQKKPMVVVYYGLLYGSHARHVYVDVYRKKRLNGMYKYKNVIREA